MVRFLQSSVYFITSMLMFHHFTENTFCTETSENTPNNVISKKSDIKKNEENKDLDILEFVASSEDNPLRNQDFKIVEVDPAKQELDMLKNKQKVMIIKMKFILNLARREDNWKDCNDRSKFKLLLDEFIFLTEEMYKIMVYSFMNQISCYDKNIALVCNNIVIIKNMYSNLMKKLDKNVSNLSIVAQLKETIICLAAFNSKLDTGYDHHLELKDKMLANLFTLKKSFKLTIAELKNYSENVLIKDLGFIKENLLKMFKLYDETDKNSVYSIEKSFKLFLNG